MTYQNKDMGGFRELNLDEIETVSGGNNGTIVVTGVPVPQQSTASNDIVVIGTPQPSIGFFGSDDPGGTLDEFYDFDIGNAYGGNDGFSGGGGVQFPLGTAATITFEDINGDGVFDEASFFSADGQFLGLTALTDAEPSSQETFVSISSPIGGISSVSQTNEVFLDFGPSVGQTIIVGFAEDASDILSGVTVSANGPVGIAVTPSGDGALIAGQGGTSATFGFDITPFVDGILFGGPGLSFGDLFGFERAVPQ